MNLASAQNGFDAPIRNCLFCHVNFRLGFEFLVGLAVIGGLVWVLQWMESSSLSVIAEHAIGLTLAGFVLFLFLRFLSPG